MWQSRVKNSLKYIVVIGILVSSIWGTYNITCQGPFLWDDEVMVQQNTTILHPEEWMTLFTSSAFGESFDHDKFYRPIQILSYMMDISLWGTDFNNQPMPEGFHITSITIHCINAILFFFVLLSLNISLISASLVSLLFALHPIHIECVSYISGRGDLLFLTFALLSTICFLHGSAKRKSLYVLSGLLFIIGSLTKENIIPLPVLFLVLTYFVIPEEKKKISYITASILTALALAFSLWRLTPGTEEALSLIANANLTHRILTLPYIIETYLRLLVWPHPLHMEYHFVQKKLFSPFIIAIPFIPCIFYCFYKFLPNKKQCLAATAWFFIALAPVVNIAPKLPSTLREHWVVLPSIGMFWILALAFDSIQEKWNKYHLGRTILIILSVGVAIILSIVTYNRNQDWLDPMKLYTHDIQYEPNSFLLYNNIGVIAFRNGDMRLAETAFQTSINVSPGQSYATAHNNLGVILENKGRISDAQRSFEASIKFNNYELGYINLGRILLKKNEAQNAINILEQGKIKYPNSLQIRYYLGVGYFLSGNYPKAKEELEWVDHFKRNFMATQNLLLAIQKGGF